MFSSSLKIARVTALPTLTAKPIGKAVIYLRVSTEEQVENYSLDTQKDICRKEAEKRGLEVAEIFREEGRSAKTANRPELIRMLEYCRKNKKLIDAVIVYRLDRISRQTSDYLAIRKKLNECEISLVSASEPTGDSPTEKFVETMLAGFAQMDNDIRSERTRNGMKARFMNGLVSFVAPLGYINKNGYVTKDPETWDLVKAAWKRIATGTTSLKEMADILNAQGVRIKFHGRKKLVCNQALSRIFKNKFYLGILVSKSYGNIEVRGQHPPMITEAEFYQVQSVIYGRNNLKAVISAKRHVANPNFPLRRLVKCAICGRSFTGGFSKYGQFGYYFCPKRCDKGHTSVPVATLEKATTRLLKKINLQPQTIQLLIAFLRFTYRERAGTLLKRREEADGEIEKLYTQRQTLIEKNLSGIYSDDVFKEQNKRIEEQITLLQYAKNDSILEKYNLEKICNFIVAKFTDLPQTYTESSLEQKRTLLSSIFPLGMPYAHLGYSNCQISDYYTCCKHFGRANARHGGP